MELLERGPVLLELSRLLGEVEEGSGRLVFVGGEAGIGKTSLVRRFGELVRDRATLLVGGCDPLSSPRPLAPLFDIADRLPGATIRLTEGKERLYQDLIAALAAVPRALVVVFEDLHWADEATLDLVRFLARRVDDRRVLVIATYRDDEIGGRRHPLRLVLGDVATWRAVRRLKLERLTFPTVRGLVAGSGLDPAEIFELTAGNPFFVTEILAAGGNRLPITIQDAVLARAARLPDPARALLEAASVIGQRCEPWLLRAVAGDDQVALDACVAAGMLEDQRDALAFRHELVREGVISAIDSRRRRTLNGRILAALRSTDAAAQAPARLAHHAEEAGDAAAVLEHAREAARRAAALEAHREAAAQYARTLRFADSLSAEERISLLAEFSSHCIASDQCHLAIRAARERVAILREIGDPLTQSHALSTLCHCLVFNGWNEEGEEASREAIALLESLPPGPELSRAYAAHAGIRMLERDTAEAIDWSRKALAIAEPAGYLRTRIGAYNCIGTAMITNGDPEGDRYLNLSLDLARDADLPSHVAMAYVNLVSAWGEWYEWDRAESCLAAGLAYAAEHELEGHVAYMEAWQALIWFFRGRWAQADELLRPLSVRESLGAISRMTSLLGLGRLKARRGDADAGAALEAALALAEPTRMLMRIGPVRIARAEAAWLGGDPGRVCEEVDAALDLALEKRHPWLAGELLSWLARVGDRRPVPAYIARPFALQLESRWSEAACEWRRLGCPYEMAQALAETGEPDDLVAALKTFESLGAGPAAKRVRRDLRRLGVRGVSRGPRPSTRSHPAGLTRREAEVAQLLTDGLQNAEIARRLFLSTKTVDHHVSNVLAKLGVRSRAEAAVAIERLSRTSN